MDINDFRVDCESGKFTIGDISEKYGIDNRKVKRVCKKEGVSSVFRSNKFAPADINKFTEIVQTKGKTYAANLYGVTLSQVINCCKKHDIHVEKYKGLLNSRDRFKDNMEDMKHLYENGYSLNHIAGLYKTNHQMVKRLLIDYGVDVMTTFDKWEIMRLSIKDNIESYKDMNSNGKSLMDIATSENISYQQLKTEFSNSNIPVKLYSYNKSHGELELKEYIESLGVDCASRYFKSADGSRFEIDCYVSEKNFGVEYCGEYWHSDYNKDRNYHKNKRLDCLDNGINLMTIFEHEWMEKKDLIKAMIKNRLCASKVIYGRKTELAIIPKASARIFHDRNHISGGLNTSFIDVGLFHDGELITCCSFSKSRFDSKYQYEILRYSTERGMVVIGGFSKMFKFFVTYTNAESVMTYADLRFGTGNVYGKTGFSYIGDTPPNYWYYNKRHPNGLESRIKYQKHKLKDLFSNYDIGKTEQEIMRENGYYRIYDCGNSKFEWWNRG